MDLINNTKETVEYTKIAVANGDGIGPEIMDVTLKLLKAAGAKVQFEFAEVGEKYYEKGYESGISDEAWEVIKSNKVFLKAPITTPQGGGYKSINVTTRKALGLYANVRPCKSYYPFVDTKFHQIDVVVIRENEEDLYAGIEYRQTENVYTALKVITRPGCEKIVRYAFDYAVKNNRKKVTCMVKDNIMKVCDGLFRAVFEEIAKEYPEIMTEVYIIDIGSARLATKPEIFDVVVTLNLYGDIVSDIVAELTGSVGLAGSANIGLNYAMFEAIHGSAPTLVGKGIANPTALINASIMMLAHIGQGSCARKISDALLYTIESGVHTPDIYREGVSLKQVSTSEFGDEVIKNLDKKPTKLKSENFVDFEFDNSATDEMLGIAPEAEASARRVKKEFAGIDIFIDEPTNAYQIGQKMDRLFTNSKFNIKLISSRGIKVYPVFNSKYIVSDEWRIRFLLNNREEITELTSIFMQNDLEIVKTEHLYNFDGKAGYSKAQGE